MVNPIGGIDGLKPVSLPPMTLSASDQHSAVKDLDFQQLLIQSLQQVSSMDKTIQTGITESLTGGDITQVEVLTAVKEVEMALLLLLQVRNKILEAYNEIKQMQM